MHLYTSFQWENPPISADPSTEVPELLILGKGSLVRTQNYFSRKCSNPGANIEAEEDGG